jgi:hypothetical protein
MHDVDYLETGEKEEANITKMVSSRIIAAAVAEVGDTYVAAEMVIINTLKEYGPDLKKLHEARKESKRQMDVLGQRVHRLIGLF